jgi:hypothetical protein
MLMDRVLTLMLMLVWIDDGDFLVNWRTSNGGMKSHVMLPIVLEFFGKAPLYSRY